MKFIYFNGMYINTQHIKTIEKYKFTVRVNLVEDLSITEEFNTTEEAGNRIREIIYQVNN